MQVYQLYFCNRGGAAWEAEGFFRGAPQPTLCVMIASAEREPVLALAQRLRTDLAQEAIGLVKGGSYGRVTV